jgi:hypothetical protein
MRLPFVLGWVTRAQTALGVGSAYRPQRLPRLNVPRAEISLNGRWLFRPTQGLGATKGSDLNLDDRRWALLDVPAFWRPVEWWLYRGVLGLVSGVYMGDEQRRVQQYAFDAYHTQAGWYRHWIAVPAEARGKRLLVHFSGVASVAEVWWNRQKIRSHIGMFGPFDCDVTPYARYGEKNLLSVFVGASLEESATEASARTELSDALRGVGAEILRLPSGCFDAARENRNGGIWSPVELVATDPVCIEDVYFRPRLDGAT